MTLNRACEQNGIVPFYGNDPRPVRFSDVGATIRFSISTEPVDAYITSLAAKCHACRKKTRTAERARKRVQPARVESVSGGNADDGTRLSGFPILR